MIAKNTGATPINITALENIYLRLLCILNIKNGNNLISKVITLLKNFEGLENTIDNPLDHPYTQVLRILENSQRWQTETRYYWVARQIAGLNAFYYQTRGDQNKWSPLLLPRTTFINLHIDNETWHDEHPFPKPHDVLVWLST